MMREERSDATNRASNWGGFPILLLQTHHWWGFGRGTIFALFQVDENNSPVTGRKTAHTREEISTIGIVQNNFVQLKLMLLHGFERDALRSLCKREDLGPIFCG